MPGDSFSCSAARSAALAARDLWHDHRLLVALVCLFLINVFLEKVQTRALPTLRVYKYLQPETCQELSMRTLQLFLGPIVFLTGVGFLLYEAWTGCNLSEIYVYWIAGAALVSVDLHEFVRRWPLRPALLAHHVMTFLIAIAFAEFHVLPPNEDRTIGWGTTLFLTFTGLMWTVDFYHVVFRVSQDLKLIKKCRTVYLCLAPVRIAILALFSLGAVNCIIGRVWFGFACMLFMAAAYAYNAYKAIMFVIGFDCEAYYNSHQHKWFAEEDEAGAAETEDSNTRSPSKPRLEQSKSLLVRQLSIPLLDAKEERDGILPGLRGDASIRNLLSDYEGSVSLRNVFNSSADNSTSK